MAIFTDGNGRFFLDTFRTKKILSGDAIGGLLEVKIKKIEKLSSALIYLAILCTIFNLSLLFLIIRGWDFFYNNLFIAALLSFIGFFLFITVILLFSISSNFITIKNKNLFFVDNRISYLLDYCLSVIFCSIFEFFCFISLNIHDYDNYYLLIFVTVMFFLFFSANAYRLIKNITNMKM